MVRNTPVANGELLNQDLGIYGQDSWTLKRLTVNAGLRWERLNAQVAEGASPAGRFVPAREFAAVENLPDWKSDWAPRFAMVYDLFGNAKTAVKYSVNKYNLSRTTGIAGNYNPLASTTHVAAVDRPERRRHGAGRQRDRQRPPRQLRVSDSRLRDQLRQPGFDLRHGVAEHLRQLSRGPTTSSTGWKSSTSSCPDCR